MPFDGISGTGTDSVGTDSVGTDSVGTDSVGTDSVGTDSVRCDATVLLAVLRRAHALIEDRRHWCRGKLFKQGWYGQQQYCALGAIRQALVEVGAENQVGNEVYWTLKQHLRPTKFVQSWSVLQVNDARAWRGGGHRAICEGFVGAIAALEQRI